VRSSVRFEHRPSITSFRRAIALRGVKRPFGVCRAFGCLQERGARLAKSPVIRRSFKSQGIAVSKGRALGRLRHPTGALVSTLPA
jgi:hypothetical protein